MSLDYIEWQRIKRIDSDQKQQLKLLKQISDRQDKQIALLENILSVLQHGQGDGR